MKWLGEETRYKDKEFCGKVGEYIIALKEMFKFNEKLFTDYPNLTMCEYDPDKKITVRWG